MVGRRNKKRKVEKEKREKGKGCLQQIVCFKVIRTKV